MTKDSVLKKILTKIAIILYLIISVYWVFFVPNKNDEHYNNEICQTKKARIKGIIKGSGGHGIYHWVEVDNYKLSFSVSFSEIKFTKCFPDAYIDFQIGDSIIKEANSNKIIIKRDTCMAVYILDCDE